MNRVAENFKSVDFWPKYDSYNQFSAQNNFLNISKNKHFYPLMNIYYQV